MKGDFEIEKIEVRPLVYWYARRLEHRLREKDAIRGHDGWHDGNITYYLKKNIRMYSKNIRHNSRKRK